MIVARSPLSVARALVRCFRTTGHGLRATGYGLRATDYRLLATACLVAFFLLAAAPVEVKVSPARATIGDRVTLTFPEPVLIDPSAEYEIVSTRGGVAVIRVLRTGEVRLWGEMGGRRFQPFTVRVESVLRPNDSLEPAPLKAPKALPTTQNARIALGIAGALALLAWGALFLRGENVRFSMQAALSADEEFRERIALIRKRYRGDILLIELADATRNYLSRSAPWLGRALTSSEILDVLVSTGASAETAAIVREILRDADNAKFSPWGGGDIDSLKLSSRALQIASPESAGWRRE